MKSASTVRRWIKELKGVEIPRASVNSEVYRQGALAALHSVLYDWPSPKTFVEFSLPKRKGK